MKTKIVVLCILFLTSAISMAVAQVSPDSVQKGLWEAFNQRYQGKWTIRWDEETGTPASIYGHRTEATSQITAGAEVVAKNFFAQNKRLFKLRANADDLTIKRQLEHQGMHHLYFLQTYSGIPVYGGEYNVTLGQDGSVRMVSGKFRPDVRIDVSPAVTSGQAEEKARVAAGIRADCSLGSIIRRSGRLSIPTAITARECIISKGIRQGSG